jgi:hypothetical protein
MSPTRADMLKVLPPFRGLAEMIDPDQTTRDIVKEVLQAHKEFAPDYDKIAGMWMDGQLNKVPKRLFEFCDKQLHYDEESGDDQNTISPAGILEIRGVDCKHYSGFIAGVLDAINRTGEYYYDWSYRFASEDILKPSPHHVFIVITGADDQEVWIDPVPGVGGYDSRPLYFWKYDKKPKMALHRLSGTGRGIVSHVVVSRDSLPAMTTARAIGKVSKISPYAGYQSAAAVGASQDAEKQLQDGLKAYELGLITSVSNLVVNKKTDTNIDTIAKFASGIPVAGSYIAIAYAAYSFFAKIASGRNYYLDKYYLYNDYTWHVLGYSSGSSDNVKDSDVPIAAMWFITKLGVFISSRTILGALWDGEDNYMNLHGNPYITMDRVRVALARQVMQKYNMNPHSPGVAGAWKDVKGVYDDAVTAAIEKARINDPNAAVDTDGTVSTGVAAGIVSNVWADIKANPLPAVLIGGALAYGLYRVFK